MYMERFYLFFREGARGRETSIIEQAPTGDGTRNPGVYPDGESNRRPCALRDNAHPTELQQPGLYTELVEDTGEPCTPARGVW